MKKSGGDLLAGRAIKKNLHPFIAAEIGNEFDIRQAVATGMVPVVMTAEDPPQILKTYSDIYLNEEVKQGGLVRQIGDFARFLSALIPGSPFMV